MVDRDARNKAAELLRRFISGQITNDDFDNKEPQTEDSAVRAIWNTAWVLYDDMIEHKLRGRHRLDPATKRECLRWIIFLDSDFEYVWPDIWLPGVDPMCRVTKWGRLGELLGFLSDRLPTSKVEEFLASGEYQAWPFASRADFKRALCSPRRLGGTPRAV